MSNATPKCELVLVICFLAVIAGVPVTQTCIELAQHERVQAADVFRYEPTAKNLRQFEHTLEDKSWFQEQLRPQLQRFLFTTLHDTGAKAVLGRNHWLFYRPDLRYIVEPDRLEADASNSKWVQPPDRGTHRESVEKAILRFRDQLKERGITLVVLPVPGKPSVYPDLVTSRAAGKERQFQSPTLELLGALQRQGVAAVDLFAAFQAVRESGGLGKNMGPLYLARDTHWTPLGAQIAAQAVAAKLDAMNLAPGNASVRVVGKASRLSGGRPALGPGNAGETPRATGETPAPLPEQWPAHRKEFRTQSVTVTRWGDILDMMQIPGLRWTFARETALCVQVLDPALGPMVPGPSDRPGTYCYPGQQAAVLVLGDSFCRIYQYPEPQSLGEMPATVATARPAEMGSKRLLPGSAGFISHLALALKSPVDAIVSDGGAATDVRRKLSTNPEILEGKQVVVWEFVERDIALGAQGWEEVALPRKLQ
ncbi:MAG: alginate O-acetyltransferase AlgX-related protein [Limisphaerales bacterium]